MKEKKRRVVVAMSGGVDSSVAALLLHHEGFEVVGITMKTWNYSTSCSSSSKNKQIGCCTIESMNDARNVAIANGFTHYTMDLQNDFGNQVINYFKDEYLSGRTPNPCVMCNTKIKWSALLERANYLDADFIATGHYANLRYENGRYKLSKGTDENKDQSYALWGIEQSALAKTIFPLSGLYKHEVRNIARKQGMKVADKNDSYEICFIPDNDYRGFLKRSMPALKEKLSNGNVIDKNGDILGHHDGYPFYTIGQRKKLRIKTASPVYVTSIDQKENTLTVGDKNDLLKRELIADQLNWVSIKAPNKLISVTAKIRYNDIDEECDVSVQGDIAMISFKVQKRAITPGQSVVFYDGNDVLGGGVIRKVLT